VSTKRRHFPVFILRLTLATGLLATGTLVSVVTETAGPAVAAEPAGPSPKSVTEGISGAAKAFSGVAKLFARNGSAVLEPYAAGFDALAAIAAPLISAFWTSDPGPSIKDVLDKLDQMSEQLDQIQGQLNAVQAELAALHSELHLAACSGLIAQLDQTLVDIETDRNLYQQLLDDASAVPTTADPTARARTLDGQFANFAVDVLGTGVAVADSPAAKAIALINKKLLNPGGGTGEGIIEACAKVGLDTWRAQTPLAAKWLDDRGYYQQIITLVSWYQTYEVEALSYIEEAAYYRATQLVHTERPSIMIPADARATVCQIAYTQLPDGSAARLCKNTQAEVTTTYDALVSQWKFTGRPYSDGTVVMSLGSKFTGSAGDIKPMLWVKDPARLPSAMHRGTWDTATLPADPIDHLTGWKPASLADWNALETDWQAVNPNRSARSPGILGAMQDSGQFKAGNTNQFYWIPGAQATYRWTIYRYYQWGGIQGWRYGGPNINVRCYVAGADKRTETYFVSWQDGAGIACSQAWWDAYATYDLYVNPVQQCCGIFDISARYYIPDFNTLYVPDPARPGTSGFLGDSSTQRRDLRDLDCNTSRGYTPCPVDLKEWEGSQTAAPEGTSHQPMTQDLMPTLAVPANPACTNSIGLPKLCTSSGNGYNDSAFMAWVNDNIPNPSLPSPTPVAAPTMSQVSPNSIRCTPADWTGTNPTVGPAIPADTTWSAAFPTPNASGARTRSVATGPAEDLNPTTMASAGGFRTDQPYRITCTVSARWANVVNSGTSVSASYQLSPNGTGWSLVRLR
jgi:hypothetical protein